MFSIQTIHGEHKHQIENTLYKTRAFGGQHLLNAGLIRWVCSENPGKGLEELLNLMKKRRLGGLDIPYPAGQEDFFVRDVEVEAERGVFEAVIAVGRFYADIHHSELVSIINLPLDAHVQKVGRYVEPKRDASVLRGDFYKPQTSIPSRQHLYTKGSYRALSQHGRDIAQRRRFVPEFSRLSGSGYGGGSVHHRGGVCFG